MGTDKKNAKCKISKPQIPVPRQSNRSLRAH